MAVARGVCCRCRRDDGFWLNPGQPQHHLASACGRAARPGKANNTPLTGPPKARCSAVAHSYQSATQAGYDPCANRAVARSIRAHDDPGRDLRSPAGLAHIHVSATRRWRRPELYEAALGDFAELRAAIVEACRRTGCSCTPSPSLQAGCRACLSELYDPLHSRGSESARHRAEA